MLSRGRLDKEDCLATECLKFQARQRYQRREISEKAEGTYDANRATTSSLLKPASAKRARIASEESVTCKQTERRE